MYTLILFQVKQKVQQISAPALLIWMKFVTSLIKPCRLLNTIHKKDILYAELSHFDVISFKETWLSDYQNSYSLHFDNYSVPYRKDMSTDNQGKF